MSLERSATLSEVAVNAGVSLATASRVLNGSTRQVTADLRERVLASARELRYVANGPAQAVARGTSRMVSLLVGDIADPYFATIAAGVTEEADTRGLSVTVAPTGADGSREAAVLAELRSQRPRALVVSPSRGVDADEMALSHELMSELSRTGAGIAYLGGETSPPALAPLRMLRVANRSAAADLARALLQAGYRSFAVLSGPTDKVTPVERAGGFTTALRAAGAPDPLLLPSALTRTGAYWAVTELLAGDTRPECMFAVTDMMAVGAMTALREQGLRPGVDVAVAGFDDIELLRDVSPALTTVALPLARIGRELLSLALDGGEAQPVLGEVRWRESTPRPAALSTR